MFEIISDSDFFFDRDRHLFTCTFYCKTDNGSFPDEEWTDFAQNVLEWWVDEILRVYGRRESKFKLFFEDGPYWIDGELKSSIIKLHFNSTKCKAVQLPAVTISFDEFVMQVRKAIRRVESSLYLNGFDEAAIQMGKLEKKLGFINIKK